MDMSDGDDDLFADEEAYLAVIGLMICPRLLCSKISIVFMKIEGAKKLEVHLLNCDGKFVSAQTTKDYGFKSIIGSGGMDIAFSKPSHHKALLEKADGCLVLFGNRKFHAASAFIENKDEIFQMAR